MSGRVCSAVHAGNLAAAEQGAGADRVPRGGTSAIFMLRVLSLLVLSLLAAAQLERSAGSSTPVHTLHENRIGVSYSESVLVIVTTVEQGLYPVAPRRLSMP